MFVCTCLTSRQVRTADCYLIVTARRRLSRNRFLSSSVCMSDLALRRQNKRIDQSEASGAIASTNPKSRATKRRTNQKRRAKRRTNQKRRANKCIDQSGASGEQLPRPIRRVSQSRAETEKAPPNQSDFVWQVALEDAKSRQKDGLSSEG